MTVSVETKTRQLRKQPAGFFFCSSLAIYFPRPFGFGGVLVEVVVAKSVGSSSS